MLNDPPKLLVCHSKFTCFLVDSFETCATFRPASTGLDQAETSHVFL